LKRWVGCGGGWHILVLARAEGTENTVFSSGNACVAVCAIVPCGQRYGQYRVVAAWQYRSGVGVQKDTSDIVIVGMGALLPGADNVSQFFDNMIAGRGFTRPLVDLPDAEWRQHSDAVFNADRTAPDSSYTNMGAPIDRRKVVELAAKHAMPLEDSFLLHVMMVEAVSQAIDNVLPPHAVGLTDVILSVINPPAEGVTVFYNRIRERLGRTGSPALMQAVEAEMGRIRPVRDNRLSVPSHIAEKVRTKFGLGGLAMRLDAACASSLATIEVAALRLREGRARYAVVGGAEDGIGNINPLVAFSQLGVMAEGHPVPFDSKADGMVMGEGAVALLLTTAAQAQQDGLPVLAVVKGIGASSDGRYGGLTEPTVPGQIMCYERTYGKNAPAEMTYLEAHGTGTKVGDRVELDSMVRFFANQSAPIGSAKWSVGHMMGAAGAVGVLRALGIMNRRMIPPSPYFSGFPTTKDITLHLNKEPLPVPAGPINIGVSAFGFGGSNFHIWLQSPHDSVSVTSATPAASFDVVVCGEVNADIKDVPNLFRQTAYRLPPKAWPFIDKTQLLSVLLAEKMFRDHGIDPAVLDHDNIHVFSGATHALDLLFELLERLTTRYMLRVTERNNPQLAADVAQATAALCEMTEMNDQSMLGTLCSLVASRVTKAFDTRGMHFSIDADYASGAVAIDIARSLLCTQSGMALVYDSDKVQDPADANLKSHVMRCTLVASLPYALEHNLPIKAVIGPMTVTRGGHAAAA
jgi:acyl transferase domain-containing protein